MSVLVAQLGARRHYAVPRALQRRGLLDRLVTDLCAEQPFWRCLDATVPRSMRPRGLESLLARRVEDVPTSRITSLPYFALSPAQQRRSGEALTDYWARRNRAFCRRVARRGFDRARSIYAFNGAALEIFEAAEEQGLHRLLDQTSAPWRWYKVMLRDEATRWPGWEDEHFNMPATGALGEREEREWQLANRIVCGSQFVADALSEAGVARERCAVVPYAGHAVPAQTGDCRASSQQEALKVLFVGTLQLGKGVQYLLGAARLLKRGRIQVRLVGPSLLSDYAMRELAAEVEMVGQVPRTEISRHYAWADAFVLPTLSEGSANVVYEAMAAGLAVVTTPNAGSIVRDGHDGLIVPPRDPTAIADAIQRLSANRDFCQTLGREAQASIARNSFERYARRLASVYDDVSEPARALCA